MVDGKTGAAKGGREWNTPDRSLPLENHLLIVTRERMKEGDSTAEIGFHLRERVLDLVLPALDGSAQAADVMAGALGLVDWAAVAEKQTWLVKGVNPWKT